jgi:hypothetical protein
LLGIALGYAQEGEALNQIKTERAEQREIVSWYE